MVQIHSDSVRETEQIGERLAELMKPGTVLALFGDLGAGKTALIRGLARGLGCRERVTSPTFSLVNEYTGRLPLFHFDLYRLPDADALFDIGWEDYLRRGGICAVEWSERIGAMLPNDAVRVTLCLSDESEDSRSVTIEGAEAF